MKGVGDGERSMDPYIAVMSLYEITTYIDG